MSNAGEKRYAAWPERLYIIDGGKVAYVGGKGPFDYKPPEVAAWLEERFPDVEAE